MVVAIDGPAGAGKTTVARLVAQRLGFAYAETGAMYRAVALLALRRSIPTSDAAALEALAREIPLRFVASPEGNRLLANGEDLTEAVRAPAVAEAASVVSTVPGVRRVLVERQRELGAQGHIVMEGRDIGTRVFPDAAVKVFLDAAQEVRGRRRLLQASPEVAEEERLEQTLAEISERDRRDRERAESPLVRAPDAVYLDTSDKMVEEVVEAILRLVRERASALPSARFTTDEQG